MSSKYLNFRLIITTFVLICHSFYNPTDSGAVQITKHNLAIVLASNEIVLINFYADWCQYSNILNPIFDDAAVEVIKNGYERGKVVMGKVDCDIEDDVAASFDITKYPTLKLFRDGLLAKEYRGQRSVKAIVEYIKNQVSDPVVIYTSLKELHNISEDKRYIIGIFDRRDQPEYQTLRKVASTFKDDCQFRVGFREVTQQMNQSGQPVVTFITDKQTSSEPNEIFRGALNSFDELYNWIQNKCIPLVREITFENAEELTEGGLPFLILFHHPTDTESVKRFKEIVNTQLKTEKLNVKFLTADGLKFAHPLRYLGKSLSDLPLIAIDSFRHIYHFTDNNDILNAEKLKEFLHDLHYNEFQNDPVPVPAQQNNNLGMKVKETIPPESIFKRLAPSKNRYTLLRDEL